MFEKIRHQRLLKRQKCFIDSHDWGKLSKYLPLDDEAEVYLIKSRWIEGIGTYQRFYFFHTPARALLIEENFGYASDSVINSGLSPEEQTLLVTKGAIKNICIFIGNDKSFNEDDEFLLVKRALDDERLEPIVINYAEKSNRLHSQKAESILMQKGRTAFVLAYIKINSKCGLTAKSEVELIKRNDKMLARAYGKLYVWQPDAQDLIDAGWLD